MTLHDDLVAAVTERLELARAATPGPWVHHPAGFMGCGQVLTAGEGVEGGDIAGPTGDLYPRGGYSPRGDMAHIAANDPATVIRACEADLERLAVHSPCTPGCALHLVPMTCHYCDIAARWCFEVRRVAYVYGLDLKAKASL